MAAPRNTGRALVHTYIKFHDTHKGRRFQARVIDMQTKQDLKCSADTAQQAVRCAREAAALGDAPTGETKGRG